MNVLKLLLNPIFLLAAGLHVGLLMLPVAGGSSDEIVPAPDPEGESITVTRIPPKETQPPKTGIGQTAVTRASRPATATTTKTPGGTKAATGRGTNQQQQAQGDSGSQASGANNRSGNSRNNQANQTARNSNPPGLPDLPPEDNTVPVETVPPETSPTLAALKDGATNQVPTLLSTFLDSLRYSFGETRDVAVEQAQQQWLEQLAGLPRLQGSGPQALDKTLDISYPIVAGKNGSRNIRRCLNPKPTQGLMGVVVDENGQVLVDDNDENMAAPVMLRSSGYKFLNDLALDNIADYTDFPDVSRPQAYIVPVNIAYNQETCVNWARLRGAETTAESDQ